MFEDIVFWAYIVMAGLGLLILVIMAVTGGLLDFGLDLDVGGFDLDSEVGGGPSPLSLPVILFTLTITGVIGAILTVAEFTEWYLNAVIAFGIAFLIAVITFVIIGKVITMVSSNAVENINRLKGAAGMVTVPIEAGKEGQVVFSSKKTGRFTVGATADEDIANDTVVVVTDIVGDIIEVTPKKKRSGGKKRSGKKKKKK